ncbi:MAG: hypothetical protein NUW01_14995, partial [Gemmatimonadaceae bacterium]|nr:hypothetical protein [Gemmatimonadaceae bacterium]
MNERGCGNDVPMETQERFPQGLGNLAENARFPHSHEPIIVVYDGKKTELRRLKQRNLTVHRIGSGLVPRVLAERFFGGV